ncbi:MFS general substrate transporter [Phanerochaete sordida]|uniref:MFS general substrate transporter n=1 Tax=Phanerochaete sordida TaxID=48140 RepID=A0A9P3L8G7_9APHY|nr:MFS general substrate transporter [Phanerochaete sordida]
MACLSEKTLSAATSSIDEHSLHALEAEKIDSHTSVEEVSIVTLEGDSDVEFGDRDARKKLERKFLRKLDLRMSIMVLIYILNYLARNNVGAARLRGIEADLHLTGQDFPTLLSILYVGYILMQIPSNMLLNYFGKPSLQLPLCMILWAMISILTGISTNFANALLTRFFLGFVEAAFFPGALFLLSKWYKRDELGLRIAILYCGNIISNAFGALLASGILDGMDGKLGRAAWRWLFFIEGALTMFVALCATFILPDFPATTRRRWFSEAERRLALLRMAEDVGVGDEDETEVTQVQGLVMAVTDWKTWVMALALTSQVVCLSFNAYFPTLSATMGFNTTVTLLLCAPPFAWTAIEAFVVSAHSDNHEERFWHVCIPFMIGLVGFVIAISTMNTAARYVSLFLMAQCYAGFVCMYAWVSNTFARPPAKRAVAIAFVNAFSQLGNVAGS